MGKSRKSKSKVNPFSVFLSEFQFKNKKRYPDREKCIQEARKAWEDQDPLERVKYEFEAKHLQQTKKQDYSKKMDSFGRPLTYLEDQRKAREAMMKELLETAEGMVKEALESGEFLDRQFVIGHVNIFFRNTGEESEADHFPAELGLAKFNLKDGLDKGCFAHHFIDSRPFPNGTTTLAYDSREEHGISILHHEHLLSRDFRAMKADIFRVTRHVCSDGTVVHDPIFVRQDNFEPFRQSLQMIFAKTGDGDVDLPVICVLEDLVIALRGNVNEYCRRVGRNGVDDIGFFRDYATRLLNGPRCSDFEYSYNTACRFHEELGDPRKCSLGFCRHRAFSIMYDVGPLAGVKLVPGRHIPGDFAAVNAGGR